jgi:deoxyribodipyrimidine photo-lyase
VGEDDFFRHLIDGSRAANRLGWQWTVGALTGKQYGFSRWQVTHRAPGMCDRCELRDNCPIEDWPDTGESEPRTIVDPRIRRDSDSENTSGPLEPRVTGRPEAVWITAESLGDDDPALGAHVDVPAIFVFDRPLLSNLRLSPVRLVFLAECLADLARRREVEIFFDDPRDVLAGRRLAATFTPVPGWRARAAQMDMVAVHPWPWLRPVGSGPLTSFSAWQTSSRGSAGGGRRR